VKVRTPMFTNKERKALEEEIDRQMLENVKKLGKNIEAIVLWQLHTHPKTRWGKKRLLEFHDVFKKAIKDLEEYYDMKTADECIFLVKYKLKEETGIDVDALDTDMFDFEIRVKE
jgi:hypothetical protein